MTKTQWFFRSRQIVICLLVSGASFLVAQEVVNWVDQRGVTADARRQWDPEFQSSLTVAPWLALMIGPLVAAAWGRCPWREEARVLSILNAQLQQQVSEREEIQCTLQSLLEFREQEWSCVSNEIHDGFVQEAVGSRMFLESPVARTRDTDVASTQQLDRALELLRRSIEEGRQLVNDLKSFPVDQQFARCRDDGCRSCTERSNCTRGRGEANQGGELACARSNVDRASRR